MSLVKCNTCGKEISSDAKTCPNCGTTKPFNNSNKKLLIIIGIAFVAVLIISSIFNKNNTKSSTDLSKPTSEIEKPIFTEKEAKVYSVLVNNDLELLVSGDNSVFAEQDVIVNKPIVITSNLLQSEYEKNEVAADQKFKGKTVAVTGVVKSLDKTIGDSISIGMNGGSNMFIHPRAEMSVGYENWVASLNKGDSVGLVCQVKGMIIGAVYLDECIPSYDWAEQTTAVIIESTPEGIKNNNNFFVKFVNVTKEITSKLKPDSKCFKAETSNECLEEINKTFKH